MKFRISYLLCLLFLLIGIFVAGFSFIWEIIVHNDPSQFFLGFLLGINVIVSSIIGYLVIKHSEYLEKIKDEIKKLNEREFEFEGFVRDNVK